MNDHFDDVSLDPPPSSVATSPAQVSCTPPVGRADPGHRSNEAEAPAGERNGNGIDFWPLADALAQRWGWLVLGGLAGAGLGLFCGLLLWKTSVTASAQLIRNDSPSAVEVLGANPTAPQTFASLLRSPELLQRVAAQAGRGVSAESLSANLRVTPDRESEVVVVSLSGHDANRTIELANVYAKQAVEFTKQLQAKTASEVHRFAAQQLTPIESEIATLNQEARARPLSFVGGETPLSTPVVVDKYQAAREELVELLTRYTDAHPAVQAQRAKLAAMEATFADKPAEATGVTRATGGTVSSTNQASPRTPLIAAGTNDFELLRGKLQALENARLALVTRQRTAQALEENPPGYYQLLAPATPNGLVKHGRKAKLLFLAAFVGMLGVLVSSAGAVGTEFVDTRLKTASDVRRVTRLPLLATAGDFARMSVAAQADWAFRTWAHLQSQLRLSAGRGAICGLTSTRHGEGRSTWVHLLAQAAHQRGFRVLTIVTRPLADNGDPPFLRKSGGLRTNGKSLPPHSTALTPAMLAAPGEVTRELVAPDSQALLHIPLPGWVWDLEQRKRWQAALRHWSQIDNLVIFVELPPASQPETILLAENLPNLVWLTDSGQATATETQEHLQILRDAHCQVAGVVLNHAPSSSLHRRFARWLNVALWFATLQSGLANEFGASPVNGDAPASPAAGAGAQTNGHLSALQAGARAPWQQRFTLGPGDVLNISLFGERELARTELPISPDGRLSYLEAQEVLAAGATIDELRARLDTELGKYRRAPRTIITPVAFHSKKYFILGSVTQRGVYSLDRPVTVLEAVARARGLETGLSEQTTVETTDLSRSFLAREGHRVPVDFEKLFQAGDLSQNVPLEPNDYLFFPVLPPPEVYVLGEVTFPGVVSYNPDLSAMAAVSVRGGFTLRAWKKKVLVVRGSLNKPETFVVNAGDVLAARSPDFKLEPKDIIFVTHRPWIKAEDLLDSALTAFVEAAVITFVGEHIGPIIK